MSKLTVKVPAIKTETGTVVPAPDKSWSHEDIMKKANVTGEHGFVLSDGTWADRKRAAEVATKAGEVENTGKKLHSHELRKARNNK